MNTIVIINMDRFSLEHDAVMLLAKELHLDEEDINAHLYNLWIDERHTGLSQPGALQQLEDWFARSEQSNVWQDAMVVVTIARQDIDIIALRTVRAWIALQSNLIPHLCWLPPEAFEKAYCEFVERNTHPGSVALEVAPEVTVVPDEERGSRIVLKKVYSVTLTAEAFVKGTLDIEVNPTFSEREIEHEALEQSGRVTWSYNGTVDGTERVESMKHTGDIGISE